MPTIIFNPSHTPVRVEPYGRWVQPNQLIVVVDEPDAVNEVLGAGHGLRLSLLGSIVAEPPADIVRFSGRGGYWGDDADGDVVYSINTVLTRDVRARTITVRTGVSVDVAGFALTATQSIINYGVIHQDGKPGDIGTGGPGGGTGAGGVRSCNPLAATAGIGGGAGGGGTSNPGDISQISGGNNVFDRNGASGGAGGASGVAGGVGGTWGAVTIATTIAHPFSLPTPWIVLALDPNAFEFVGLPCGCGGGGGASAGGGGGGGGAGMVRLRAPLINNGGIIRARGGAGGQGAPAGGGGGGGGGGGRIILVGSYSGIGTLDVSGGAAGAGTGAGSAGVAGATGTVHRFS